MSKTPPLCHKSWLRVSDMTALCIFIVKSDSCSVSAVGAISVTVALTGINLRQKEILLRNMVIELFQVAK